MSCRINKLIEWSPWDVLLQQQHCNQAGTIPYAIVILNRPIQFDVANSVIVRLWNEAQIRCTVDGGTDRWLQWIKANKFDKTQLAEPDIITGDMDSISASTLEHFKAAFDAGTRVVYTSDQNETDFTKAVRTLQQYCNVDTMFVLSQWSGRFDQLISNVNTLYKVPAMTIYMLCPDTLTWLLVEGEHSIAIPQTLIDEKQCCGLLPIGSPARVTTRGLKWNLNKTVLEFGALVSSSNTYSGDESHVYVRTDRPIIWTMEIAGLL